MDRPTPRADHPPKGEEAVARAAARVLARHHRPDWRPATDGELDAWGHGYGVAARDRHAQDLVNRVDEPSALLDCDWPPVTPPGGGA